MIFRTVPPAVEWDFRGIDPMALPDATLYEYARTSERLRVSACAWLDSSVNGRKLREHLLQRLRGAQRGGPIVWGEDVPRGKCSSIIREGFRTVPNWQLVDLIVKARPDFPAPWTAARMSYRRNSKYSTVAIQPEWVTVGGALGALKNGDTETEIEERSRSLGKYTLTIHWGDSPTIEQIVSDFSAWVRREAKRHSRPRGKAAHAHTEPLKWLAAYRLSEAGLTFPQIQVLMDCYLDQNPDTLRYARNAGLNVSTIPASTKTGETELLPVIADKSTYSRALAGAKRFLARVESNGL